MKTKPLSDADKKVSGFDALSGLTAGLAVSSIMMGLIGETMFGNDNTGAIKVMMEGLVEAYEKRTDALKDDLKREEERAKETREEAREAQVTIAKLHDEMQSLRIELDGLKAKKPKAKA